MPTKRHDWRAVLICCGIAFLLALSTVIQIQHRVDLNSGRISKGILFLGARVTERTLDTDFSRLVEVAPDTEPDWRVYYESSVLQPISPHFVHHSSPSLMEKVVMVGNTYHVPKEELQERGKRILVVLRDDETADAEKLVESWWQSLRPD